MKPDSQVFAGLLGMIAGLLAHPLAAVAIVVIVLVVALVGLYLCRRVDTPKGCEVDSTFRPEDTL